MSGPVMLHCPPWSRALAGGALLFLAGCAGGGSSPLVPAPSGAGAPPVPEFVEGNTLISEDGAEVLSIPGGYTLSLSLDPLTAELTPWRSNTGIQGKLYDLDIENFLTGDSLKVTGLRTDADGNVIVDYTFTHPYAPPNFANPPTSTNRADLGVTGRVLFLGNIPAGDVPGHTFFGSTVANTDLVLNADSYIEPGDLLAAGSFNVDAHPGLLIVNEGLGANGNRNGISNGGNPRGNYDPATGGWQRGNIGANNNGWTGYDYLHHGQSASNSAVISRAAIEAGNAATIQLAVMVKYTDPHGLGGKLNPQVRFPQNPTDATLFAYRLPNGALDASRITFQGEADRTISLSQASGSNQAVTILVRDWDAAATATTQTEISDDPDISHVNIGTAGAPTLLMSAPGLSTTDFTFTAGGQSGIPGQEIQYTGTVTNGRGVAAPGSRAVGLARCTDPENSAPGRANYHFGLDPVTVTPSATRAVPVITYQALYVDVTSSNRPPGCGTLDISTSTIPQGGTFSADLSGIVDADGDSLTIGFSYDGPSNSSSSTLTLTPAQWATETTFNPFTDSRLTSKLTAPSLIGSYTFAVSLDDGQADPVVCSFPFTVTAATNVPPDCGTFAAQFPKSIVPLGSFTLDLTAVDDPDSASLSFIFSYAGASSSATSPITFTIAELAAETAFNPFTDGRLTTTLVAIGTVGDYTLSVNIDDGTDAVDCGPFDFTVEGTPNAPPSCGDIAINGSGVIIPGGDFTVDLSGADDPDSTDLDISFAYTGPESSTSGAATIAVASLGAENAFNPFTDVRVIPPLANPVAEGVYQLTVTLNDQDNQVSCGPFAFSVQGAETSPPNCGTGISLSDTSFTVPETVDFTIDMSALADPDSLEATVSVYYTGPENAGTSEQTVPYPLPSNLNPFTNPGFGTPLTAPTTVGVYTLFVRLEDFEGNFTECAGAFDIVPTGGGGGDPFAVGDLTVEVNYTDVPAGGATVDVTDTLTVTWQNTNAPEYAVYADLSPTPPPPITGSANYRPDDTTLIDNLELIGTTSTTSFTGFEIDPLVGFFQAYIVVRARTEAGNAASELADSEPGFVGILADAEPLLQVGPWWLISGNQTAGPALGLFTGAAELNGGFIGISGVEVGSIVGLCSYNVPDPMLMTIDRAITTGSFFTETWNQDEEQGLLGGSVAFGLTGQKWGPTQAPGTPYGFEQPLLDGWFSGTPPAGTFNATEVTAATTGWYFYRYRLSNVIGDGSLSAFAYNFNSPATTDTTDLAGYDEIAYVYD